MVELPLTMDADYAELLGETSDDERRLADDALAAAIGRLIGATAMDRRAAELRRLLSEY